MALKSYFEKKATPYVLYTLCYIIRKMLHQTFDLFNRSIYNNNTNQIRLLNSAKNAILELGKYYFTDAMADLILYLSKYNIRSAICNEKFYF